MIVNRSFSYQDTENELYGVTSVCISREKLLEKGFAFKYFTSTFTTNEGKLYKYCYEQGYLEMDKGYCLLVVKNEI